jgi:hypothetical protein
LKQFFQCVHCKSHLLVKEREGGQGLLDMLIVTPQGKVILNESGVVLKKVPQICINCGKNGVIVKPNREIGSTIGSVLKELERRKKWAP